MRKLVLWGQHIDEYKEMFSLSDSDLQKTILDYGSGPNAVNAEFTEKGGQIVSCDPLFNLDKDTLFSKTSLIFADMAAKIKKDKDKFDFSRYGSFQMLIDERKEGIDKFFADFDKAKDEQRCLAVKEHNLPFADFSFDLALSAHYLFADLDDQDVNFHLAIIKELARVAKEVRIFPLIDRHNQPSPFLGPVLLGLQAENYGVEVKEVKFHLQESDNAMLRVYAQQCQI